jgi:iron complex transport system ATP-binding protein
MMLEVMLELANVSFSYGSLSDGVGPVLRSISAQLARPELVALVGPNGAGKSTLVNVLAGRLRHYGGHCRIYGSDLATMKRAELCRLIAHVPQQRIDDVPFTVEEVVLTGRTPHGNGLFESDEDLAAVESALALTHLEPFRNRLFSQLSGGEQQRVLVAAALAQAAPILLLDEPGAHLDPENQTALWDLLGKLRDSGKLILIVTHHLNLAAQRADRVWVLSQGLLVADAPPADAMRPEQMSSVFHVPFQRHVGDNGSVFLNYG